MASLPTEMTIQIDWDEYLAPYTDRDPRTGEEAFGGPRTVEDIIVERAAYAVAEKAIADATSYQGFREMVREQIREIMKVKVTEAIEAELAKPIQPTNSFGHPKGEPYTFTEHIERMVADILNTATTDRNSARGRDEGPLKPVNRAIRTMVGPEIERQVREEIQKAKNEVMDAVTESAAEVLTEAVRRAVR